MTPSNHLFDLIKSLTKAEKRTFKLSASVYRGNKIYLELFDAVDAQDVYDEEKIKKKFAEGSFIRQLPVWKNYLKIQILNSLSSFSDEHKDDELEKLLRYSKILVRKDLYDIAKKFLLQAQNYAKEREAFTKLVEIYRLQRKLINAGVSLGKTNRMLIEEINDAIERENNIIKRELIYDDLYQLYRKYGKSSSVLIKEVLQKIDTVSLFNDNKKWESHKSKLITYWTQALFYFMQKEYKKSLLCQEEAIQHFESSKRAIDNNPGGYMSEISRLILINSYLHNYTEIRTLFKKLVNIAKSESYNIPMHYKAHSVLNAISSILNYHLLSVKHEEAVRFIKQFVIKQDIQHFLHNLPTSTRAVLYHNIAYSFFCTKNYKEALKWVNDLINQKSLDTRFDTQANVRLLNLMIHYELKNYDTIESIGKSADRFISNKAPILKFENMMIKFISGKLINSPSQNQKKAELIRFKAQLEKNNFINNASIENDHIISWLTSKIEDRPYADILKRSISGHNSASK